MYQITYKKQNGVVFNRIRNTLPVQTVGEVTSMGWIILDIKKNLNGKYYSHHEYYTLLNKKNTHYKTIKNIKKYIKKYALYILYVPLITMYFIK